MKTLLLPLLLGSIALACPKQRADVKNMTDAAAKQISANAELRSISELAALERPSADKLRERTNVEKRRFRVNGTIAKIESEADGDMKLFLTDEKGAKLIAEVPETECVAKAYRSQVEKVKRTLAKVKVGTLVTLDGVGYWGYVREGETASNGIQLHPVLEAQLLPHNHFEATKNKQQKRLS